MKIEFVGAAQGVTGSKHLLHINGKKILMDCGLFQGHRKKAIEWNKIFPFKASEIDALVLSHAHIDHSGAIPLLIKNGFTGPIYCTHATRDLCAVMLRDSAYIQEREAEFLKKRKHIKDAEPLYTIADAEKSLSHFRSVAYHQSFRVADSVKVQFLDAGHIFGSAMEEWDIEDHDTGQKIKLGFTGDLGRKSLPILKDVEQMTDLDVYLTESTYGDRLHDEVASVEENFAKNIVDAHKRGGKIIIPAFAMGRTQEILYMIKKLKKEGKIPQIPIFVDSPLAQQATEVFSIHQECYDEEMVKLMDKGIDPFCDCDGTQFTHSVEESKALNKFPGSCIIISASGMCEFGRIKHHLDNNIGDSKNLLLIVGYQAENTLGRKLVNGENPVNIFGEPHNVELEIVIYNAFSGHADQKGLLRQAANVGKPKNVFVVHGENKQQEKFIGKLRDLENIEDEALVVAPAPGDIYELKADKKFVKSSETNPTSRKLFGLDEIIEGMND